MQTYIHANILSLQITIQDFFPKNVCIYTDVLLIKIIYNLCVLRSDFKCGHHATELACGPASNYVTWRDEIYK